MRLLSYRLVLATSLLLLLAACAEQIGTATPPSPGSAPLAVDLGGSSRISRIAGRPGEGEGYDAVQAAAPAHGSMAAMAHEATASMPKASVTTADHGSMGHGQMDHSKMGHGTMPAQAPASSAAPQVAQAPQVQGNGTVNSIDAAGHKVNLNHGAIPAIGWPAMTMDFSVAHSVDLRALKPGSRINFTMQRGGDGMYVIQSITPAGGQ